MFLSTTVKNVVVLETIITLILYQIYSLSIELVSEFFKASLKSEFNLILNA